MNYYNEWLLKNPDYFKEYAKENREHLNKYHREYYHKNRTRIRNYYKEYMTAKKKQILEDKKQKLKQQLMIMIDE